MGANATVTKLRISVVQYLNTAPLVWGFTNGPLRGKYDLSFTVPSQCAEALRTRAADVAIIPAIEYQRIPDLVVLPDLSIASKGPVRSLLLIAKTPIEQARRIALDRSSRSTQALTRILCAERWRIAPQFVEADPDLPAMLRDADAALLIGDAALRISVAIEIASKRGVSGEQICSAASMGIPGADTLHVYDVVEEWRRMTNLPAVLAIWAGRAEVINEEIVDDFQCSRDLGLGQLDEISRQAATQLGVPAMQLKRYLSENIDFTLDEENLRGLETFFRFAAPAGLIPCISRIAIIEARSKPSQPMGFALGRET